jgi:hypothetical protein
MISPDLGDRIRRPSSAPVTDDLQATVFEILVKIAASREDPEVLNGRALFPILNRIASLRRVLIRRES